MCYLQTLKIGGGGIAISRTYWSLKSDILWHGIHLLSLAFPCCRTFGFIDPSASWDSSVQGRSMNLALLSVCGCHGGGRLYIMVSYRMTETVALCPILVLILSPLVCWRSLLDLTLLFTESIALNNTQGYRGQLWGETFVYDLVWWFQIGYVSGRYGIASKASLSPFLRYGLKTMLH